MKASVIQIYLDIGAMLVEDIVDITDCGTERKRSTVKLMR